ncbi:hypothetical protein JET64_11135 [Pseudomonas putida]|nr:hypothetical protein [Pseudomonas putida]
MITGLSSARAIVPPQENDYVEGYLGAVARIMPAGAPPTHAQLLEMLLELTALFGFSHYSYQEQRHNQANEKVLALTSLPSALKDHLDAYRSMPSRPTLHQTPLDAREALHSLLLPIPFTITNTGILGFHALIEHQCAARPLAMCWETLHLIVKDFVSRARPALVNALLTLQSPKKEKLLSSREHSVLGLAAHGLSTAEIAQALGLSDKGVEFHLDSCKRKLHVRNRTHAVSKAMCLGILVLTPDLLEIISTLA